MTNQDKHPQVTDLYGLIVCGGNSRRMGVDKSLLLYHEKPQCYHLYEMLEPFCEKVFISCNDSQLNKFEVGYLVSPDLPAYHNSGPMAAVLTAFKKYPGKDIVIIGCDYPFLTGMDIRSFLASIKRTEIAAAFYNEALGFYEPLAGYYNKKAEATLLKMHANNEYSLQHFLKNNNAVKFYPKNIQSMQSIDTKEDFIKTKALIDKQAL